VKLKLNFIDFRDRQYRSGTNTYIHVLRKVRFMISETLHFLGVFGQPVAEVVKNLLTASYLYLFSISFTSHNAKLQRFLDVFKVKFSLVLMLFHWFID
jgi:hypothetical protein